MEIVAEIGASHNGKIKNVFKLINECTEADAFKLQTWAPDSMAIDHKIETGAWKGWSAEALYKKARLPWEWHGEIFDYCRRRGIEIFSTPFDRASVDFLERLGCPRYKVASYELVDLPLVRYIAETGKPMIWSTGQITDSELLHLVGAITPINDQITLLHCVSQYPTNLSATNLWRMDSLRRFGFPVGISDHSAAGQLRKGSAGGHAVPIAAAALGASMIEKHVAIGDGGLDGHFALRTEQFNRMALLARQAALVMGSPDEYDYPDFSLRRSLYYAHSFKSGHVIRPLDLRTRRPNRGASPLLIEKILGKKLAEDVEKDDPVLPGRDFD